VSEPAARTGIIEISDRQTGAVLIANTTSGVIEYSKAAVDDTWPRLPVDEYAKTIAGLICHRWD